MALHKDFPKDPYATLDPNIRWFPADKMLRKIAVKVVDILGNDTIKVIEVKI